MDSPSRSTTAPEAGPAVAAILIALILSAPALASPIAPEGPTAAAAPLTNERIVRLAAAGHPEAEIIRIIEQAEATDFDLDPELIAEMKLAGVSDAVIEAMRRTRPAAPPAVAAPPREVAGAMILEFERAMPGEAAEAATAVVPAVDGRGRTLSLAVYLICHSPMHVPDFWDRNSPLGAGPGRHHFLWMSQETIPLGGSGKHARVGLALPEKVRVALAADAHDLELGVALQAGVDAWARLVGLAIPWQTHASPESVLKVRIRTRRPPGSRRREPAAPGISVELVSADPPLGASPQPPTPAPPDPAKPPAP